MLVHYQISGRRSLSHPFRQNWINCYPFASVNSTTSRFWRRHTIFHHSCFEKTQDNISASDGHFTVPAFSIEPQLKHYGTYAANAVLLHSVPRCMATQTNHVSFNDLRVIHLCYTSGKLDVLCLRGMLASAVYAAKHTRETISPSGEVNCTHQ